MAVRPKTHRFNIEQYFQMAEAGIFGAEDRVELIEGEIVEMTPIGPNHASVIMRLNQLFVNLAGDQALLNPQNPLRLSEYSLPQPDLVLLSPRADFYREAHPGPADVLLVIEVADTSLDYDRVVKGPLYAASGIDELWIIDLQGGHVEVFTEPGPQGYGKVETFGPDDTIHPKKMPLIGVDLRGILAG